MKGLIVGNPFDPTEHHQPNPDAAGDEPTRFVTPPQPGQPPAGQQPWPGQQWPGQQQGDGQPYPGQPYPGQQPFPGQQPYPGQPPVGGPQQPGAYPPPGIAPPPGFGPPPGLPPIQGGYPGGPGGQPPRVSRNKWIAGGAVVVSIIVIVALVAFFWPTSGKKNESSRPAPNASAQELLITQADFPHLDGGNFTTSGPDTSTSTSADDAPSIVSGDPQCKEMMDSTSGQADSSADEHSATLESDIASSSDSQRSYEAKVKKTVDTSFTTDFDNIVSKCGSFSVKMRMGGGMDITGDVSMKRLAVNGVDGDYNGVEMQMKMQSSDLPDTTFHMTFRILMAISRSVSYEVTYQEMTADSAPSIDSNVNSDLASMLNKQRQRILNAQ